MIYKWYCEEIARTLLRVSKELYDIYATGTLERDEALQVKGGMAALSLVLENMNHDLPRLHKYAAAQGETADAEATFSIN